MGLEGKGKKWLKKGLNVMVLGTTLNMVQPPTDPSKEMDKPAGVREAVKKSDGQNEPMVLPDGRRIVMNDSPPQKKKPEEDPRRLLDS